MRIRVFGMILVVLSFYGLDNLAAEKADDEAMSAFKKGKTLFMANQYLEAADMFRRAHKLRPSWKILYNIGQAEAAAKRYGLALDSFERYLTKGGDDISEDRQTEVMKELTRLRKLVGYLKISSPAGSEVLVDGVARGTAPLNRELPVAARVNHQVTAAQDGATIAEKNISVSGGRTVQLKLVTETLEMDNPSLAQTLSTGSDDETRESSSPLKLWGWIATGVGAAVLVTGIVTGGLAKSKESELADDCPGNVCPSGYDFSTQDQRDNLALTTDILIPTGAVIAAAGATMLIVHAIREKKEKKTARYTIAPAVAQNYAGLFLEWRF